MIKKPILLDLFCKAGGAGTGYARAGFEVIGVDIEPQPHYPFAFYQGDALKVVAWGAFDAVHASPPCKVHTSLRAFSASHHVDLIPATRAALSETGLPYVIENVPGAPLLNPLVLCGSMFPDLMVRRHRLFESNVALAGPLCDHAGQVARSPGFMVARYDSGVRKDHWSPVVGVYGGGQGLGPGEVPLWRKAMGIDWMTRDELAQAIPPAYTEHIGRQLIKNLR